MDLSVCIVSWNVKDDLAKCLSSLDEGARGIASEIIVVDNASSDGSPELVAAEFPRAELIANRSNVGFAAANVQAMDRARGRHILLLNPDTLVPPGALAQLVRFADEHPRAGVVGPKLVYGDGRLQHSCRRFPTIAAALFRNTLLGALVPCARASASYLMEEWDHNEAREVDWVSGACMMIRREAFEEVGALDAGFYWGSEDVDYCWRVHEAGWQVLYTPEPMITHFVGRSTDQVMLRTIVRTHRSMYRLYSRHLARNPLSRGGVWLGVWARAALLIAQHFVQVFVDRLRGAKQRLFPPKKEEER